MGMKDKAAERGTRTGFTTGACAAAAARAAVLGMVDGAVPQEIESLLPNGSRVRFAVHEGRSDSTSAHAMVIKFAGDDPDCTDGAHLTVDLRLLPGQAGEVTYVAGDGVGTVTMRGLGLEVGGPAINPVPRRNIADNLREAAPALLQEHGIEVTISVPDGQTMAKKTTNARLGILGGISILGTTGIVKPYSTAAWRASVVQGVQVAATAGHGIVALTTGGRTETFAIGALRAERPELPSACFVQMGDFLRYALDEAVAQGIGLVVLTHANRSEVDTDLVAAIARQIGAAPEDCEAMAAAETARFGAELMVERGLGDAFHHALAQAAIDTLTAPDRYGRAFQLRVMVCDFSGVQVADVWSLPALPNERPVSAGRIGIDHLPEADNFHQ
jgi:cobalt-precorrin-5B (C1)-methyltransferase